MARLKKDAPVDLGVTHELSTGIIERLTCPSGLSKVFLRDKDISGLRVRVTANGAKAFVYEAKLNGKAISKTLGKFPLMSIDEAKVSARNLARTVKNDKKDPRELERQQLEVQRVQATAMAESYRHASLTGHEVWQTYIQERRPYWGERHYLDHISMVRAGGVASTRGTKGRGVTIAGPLFALLAGPLRSLNNVKIETWAASEAKTRPTVARLAWRCLKAFLNWCAEQPEYAPALHPVNPAKTKKTREALGKPKVKQDALLREQLTVWFDAVHKINNPTISAYLQTLLLTGARPGEIRELQWSDINTKWQGLTIRDKVEGERVIPLTPYVSKLLHLLPRRNEWVFASNQRGGVKVSGTMARPNTAFTQACKVAGIDGLTLHGLRRSFKSLTEWLEIPAGVVAQLMGHKPSATAEKHYTVRPLDLLRVHHEKIEAWILEQAGIVIEANSVEVRLRVVPPMKS